MKSQPMWSYRAHWAVHVLERVEHKLIVPVRRTSLAALDLVTGEELWRTRRQEVVSWDIATTTTHAFVRGRQSLTALLLSTGEVVWQIAVPPFSGWIHAVQDTVMIGGWRGYSPIQAYDTKDGCVVWTHPLHGAPIRTGIYAPLKAAFYISANGKITFLRLTDGQVGHELEFSDLDIKQRVDFIPKGALGRRGASLLVRGANTRIYRIMGSEIAVECHTLGQQPVTQVLEDQRGELFFFDDRGSLCVYDFGDGVTSTVGWPAHNAAWSSPVTRTHDGSVVVGTSFGQLLRFRPGGQVPGQQTVGRRILTKLHVLGDLVVFGTQSGEVVAWRWEDLR
ncbi:outer membrane protein assembly factor BamB family protein [Deinococcus aquaedulcis]|uniref:outer membrane protein assembly factor BamB family protein n=1 Tax=Deinococcus aquaedulcis TaxID=2840455 RepID=UPI001C83F175|nr:PQQ-binding-like beta-propeller repeat protein [Deinococcus aquaedulcis]